ncbi:MAG: hypothetical protein NT154_15510 [Verrucomicrobia bacterium]|nr:hypothetical protein [Verrucomicrobiota bacterium]
MIDDLAGDLDFIDLNSKEVLTAFKEAQERGVRGGRAHDCPALADGHLDLRFRPAE